ncbi:hypothetical protein N9L74_04045 [Luminiphilus sp.]|nr:hypothetical protein [Luminiphilus sp.]
MNDHAEKTDASNANDTLSATIESTGDQIFKVPETGSDVVVTGAALIAIIIVASYIRRFF